MDGSPESTTTERAPTPTPVEGGGFAVPTRAQVREKRQQEADGFWFALPQTGGHARVRHLSVAEKATLGALSTEMQTKLVEVFNEERKRGDDDLTVARMNRYRDRQEELANAVCIAGFIQPRLVETEADLDPADPHCWVVTDLHVTERIAFLNLVLGRDEAAVKRLVPFRRPAVGTLSAVPAGADGGPTVLGPDRAAGDG